MAGEGGMTFVLGGRNEGVVREEQLKELADLERTLGFVETENMIVLRNQFIAELQNRVILFEKWSIEAEEIVVEEMKDNGKLDEALIAMDISKARMYLKTGLMDFFNETLDEVSMYAKQLKRVDILEKIKSIRNK